MLLRRSKFKQANLTGWGRSCWEWWKTDARGPNSRSEQQGREDRIPGTGGGHPQVRPGHRRHQTGETETRQRNATGNVSVGGGGIRWGLEKGWGFEKASAAHLYGACNQCNIWCNIMNRKARLFLSLWYHILHCERQLLFECLRQNSNTLLLIWISFLLFHAIRSK